MKILKNEINEKKSTDEKLIIDTTVEFDEPIRYTDVTIDKPEGMSDTQFEIFCKHLQEEVNKYNVHEGELTS
jgi:aminoglycoside phosphotransferase family enzyme